MNNDLKLTQNKLIHVTSTIPSRLNTETEHKEHLYMQLKDIDSIKIKYVSIHTLSHTRITVENCYCSPVGHAHTKCGYHEVFTFN